MDKKSFISVNQLLIIIIAVIMIVSFFTALMIFFPWVLGSFTCPQRQRDHINEINTIAEDAKLTGITYIVRFKVEYCVKCIWYNTAHQLLEVEFESWKESFSTPLPWVGIDEDLTDCNEAGVLKTDKVCNFEINPNTNQILVIQPC